MEIASNCPAERRKEVLWPKGDAILDGSGHQSLLAVRRDKATGSAARLRISPTPDTENAPPGHSRDGINATAYANNCVSRFHHSINVAIIAPMVKAKRCDIRHYSLGAKYATFSTMPHSLTPIDKNWIKERLATRGRGAQARLAEHLGLQPNVMSKIMNGTRALQQDEVPKVLEFFNARIVIDDTKEGAIEQLLRDAGRLNSEGLQLLRSQLNGILQTPALLQSHGSSEPSGEPDPK